MVCLYLIALTHHLFTAFVLLFNHAPIQHAQQPPPQLHYVQHGNQLLLIFSNLPISWMPPFLVLENRRDSPLDFPKDETGWGFFHWLHSGRSVFLPREFKGSLMREGFKTALWKCCSQDRHDSQRPCIFRLWQFLHSEWSSAWNYAILLPETIFHLIHNPCTCE